MGNAYVVGGIVDLNNKYNNYICMIPMIGPAEYMGVAISCYLVGRQFRLVLDPTQLSIPLANELDIFIRFHQVNAQ